MLSKLTGALFLAGALVVPATGYATGTSATQATDSRSATQKTKDAVGDAAITTKVKAKFAADNQVSAMNIKVDTDNGVVKLSGDAKSRAEAEKAEQIAKSTEGVTAVTNDIRVGASSVKY